jgi:hypothetical protein
LEFEPFCYDTLEFRRKLLVNEPPEYLYHYTTAAGFLGIIQSSKNNIFKMWASDSRYLNDSSEYIGGLEVAKECLSSSIHKSSSLIQKAIASLSENNGRVVVLSLSSKGDFLSQWRAYSENGGYSIELRTELFKAKDYIANHYLAKCIYSKEELSVRIDECIKWHQDKFSISTANQSQEIIDHHRDNCLRGLVGTIRALATLFKHESFSGEFEWRYVVTYPQGNELNIRNRNGLLVPYILLCFPEKSISQVTVAPGSRQLLAKLSAEDLLSNTDKDFESDVELSGSSFTWE